MKSRNLKTGKAVKELDKAKTLTVYTKCPEKYLMIDLETGEQYFGNPEDNKNSWNRLSEDEWKTILKILDKL